MKKLFLKLILFLSLFLPLTTIAQETAPKQKAPASARMQRKVAKQKWKEQRKLERDQQRAVSEHHKRLQSKQTLKQMKRERNKSDKFRDNKREFFLVRWFKYRKH